MKKLVNEYISKAKNLRTTGQLIISYEKLHLHSSTSTIARWCINILQKAVIDIESYSSRSIRSASANKAKVRGLSMVEINRATG